MLKQVIVLLSFCLMVLSAEEVTEKYEEFVELS